MLFPQRDLDSYFQTSARLVHEEEPMKDKPMPSDPKALIRAILRKPKPKPEPEQEPKG